MQANQKLALLPLVVAVGLGVAAAGGGAPDTTDREATAATGPLLASAGLAAVEHELQARIASAAKTRPLVAALETQVDGSTLTKLLAMEPWWRELRKEFQVSRV